MKDWLSGFRRPTIRSARECTLELGTASTTSAEFPSGGEDGRGEVQAGGRSWAFQHVSIGRECIVADRVMLIDFDHGVVEVAEVHPGVLARAQRQPSGPDPLHDPGAPGAVQARQPEHARPDAAAARKFFEDNFRPVRISKLGEPQGFLTGYFEPIVQGSRFPSPEFHVPLYRRPRDLVATGHKPGADNFPKISVARSGRFQGFPRCLARD